MVECSVCYELTDDSGLCHPTRELCFDIWKKTCARREHRTLRCPFCSGIWKHQNDDREVMFCNRCDRDVLVGKREIRWATVIEEEEDEMYIRYLFSEDETLML
jgi:hypothetical protein